MTHTRRFGQAVKRIYLRFFRKSLCTDCRATFDSRMGIAHKLKHRAKSSGRKLRAGIHHVRIRGKMRKVKVLSNGRWRFMKGR